MQDDNTMLDDNILKDSSQKNQQANKNDDNILKKTGIFGKIIPKNIKIDMPKSKNKILIPKETIIEKINKKTQIYDFCDSSCNFFYQIFNVFNNFIDRCFVMTDKKNGLIGTWGQGVVKFSQDENGKMKISPILGIACNLKSLFLIICRNFT
jgi:hypothetical protein